MGKITKKKQVTVLNRNPASPAQSIQTRTEQGQPQIQAPAQCKCWPAMRKAQAPSVSSVPTQQGAGVRLFCVDKSEGQERGKYSGLHLNGTVRVLFKFPPLYKSARHSNLNFFFRNRLKVNFSLTQVEIQQHQINNPLYRFFYKTFSFFLKIWTMLFRKQANNHDIQCLLPQTTLSSTIMEEVQALDALWRIH